MANPLACFLIWCDIIPEFALFSVNGSMLMEHDILLDPSSLQKEDKSKNTGQTSGANLQR